MKRKQLGQRLGAVLLLLCLTLSILPLSASAANEAKTAEEAVKAGLLAYESEIDITQYGITTDEISLFMQNLQNTSPELFHVSSQYSYSYDKSTGKVSALRPQYTVSREELPAMREFYQMKLGEILALAPADASDAELLLFFHDYICLNFAYDTTYSRFDVYSFFRDGSGVCQAYTLLYLALLEASGIEAGVAVSTEMNHIWNIVVLDGQSYHVDVTWDDALTDNADVPGRAYHKNFLLSDAGIRATEHTGWVPLPNVSCTDTRYEDSEHKSILADYDGAFAWVGAEGYGEANGVISRFDDTLLEGETLYTVEATWRPYGSPSQYYSKKYSDVAAYGELLYFNTPDALYSLDPVTLTAVKVKEVTGRVAFGLYRLNDALILKVGATADAEGLESERYTPPSPCKEAHSYQVAGETSPTYDSPGERLSVCTVCGNRKTEEIPMLARPSAEEYREALSSLKRAEDADAFLTALIALKELEPLISPDEIAEEKAEADALVAAYDSRVVAIRNDSAQALTALFESQSMLLGGLLSIVAVFLLVFKHIL